MSNELAIEILKATAWPMVVVIAFLLFRQPLLDLVAQVARRANKLSILEVSVELATLPERSPPWSVGKDDVRQLCSSQIFDSATQTLFQELLKHQEADYALIDLGEGREWLTSRLFIFALVLGSVSRVRAFAFVETARGVRRRLLGVATPTDIQRSLTKRYPWFEEAYFRAAVEAFPPQPGDSPGQSRFTNQAPIFDGNEQWRVSAFVRQFVANLQRKTTPSNLEQESHLELKPEGLWERAHWINGERLERDLTGCLGTSKFQSSPDITHKAIGEAVGRREGAFVAIVDEDCRLVDLIDRYALLDQLGKQFEVEAQTVKPNRP